jgi:predicted ATPase
VLLETFDDGVYLVELTSLRDPALVGAAIALALGVKEAGGRPVAELLTSYLRDKALLLLLDNLEQVLDAAPLVAGLLAACPRLTILATSRVPLRLRAERQFLVDPLALPDAAQLTDIAAIVRAPAVALFVERAQAVAPDFVLTSENAAAVATICIRLDGLPLAIELAAARSKLFAPTALLRRLDRRLALLSHGPHDLPRRQQTLRAAITWSYDLLSEAEQRLFRRLGIFVGGCTLDAVAAVCDTDGDLANSVVDGMAALLDQSLVQREMGADGEPRFTMLETIREYALEQLEASDEAENIQRPHAEYYLMLAETAEAHLRGPEQAVWLDRLDNEHDNFRAVLAWSIERRAADLGLRLAGALYWFWEMRAYQREGGTWLEEVLAHPQGAAAWRAKALAGAGALAWQVDPGQAIGLLTKSLMLYRAIEDESGIARASLHLGELALYEEDYGQAISLCEESLRLFRKLKDKIGIAWATEDLGGLMLVQKNYVPAKVFLEESFTLGKELGDRRKMASSLRSLGFVALMQGEHQQAAQLCKESLILCRQLGHKRFIVDCLLGLAGAAAIAAQPKRAVQLLGVAEMLREDIGIFIPPVMQNAYNFFLTIARSQLDAAIFAATWEAGRALSLEQAVAEALGT